MENGSLPQRQADKPWRQALCPQCLYAVEGWLAAMPVSPAACPRFLLVTFETVRRRRTSDGWTSFDLSQLGGPSLNTFGQWNQKRGAAGLILHSRRDEADDEDWVAQDSEALAAGRPGQGPRTTCPTGCTTATGHCTPRWPGCWPLPPTRSTVAAAAAARDSDGSSRRLQRLGVGYSINCYITYIVYSSRHRDLLRRCLMV